MTSFPAPPAFLRNPRPIRAIRGQSAQSATFAWPGIEPTPHFGVKSVGFEGPMRYKSVVGNWKLNGSLASNEALLKALLRDIPRGSPVACAVCVPAPFL